MDIVNCLAILRACRARGGMKCYCSAGAESTGQREGRISGSCSDGAPKRKISIGSVEVVEQAFRRSNSIVVDIAIGGK